MFGDLSPGNYIEDPDDKTCKAKVEAKVNGDKALHVISEIKTISQVPANRVYHNSQLLFNGSNSSMDVNGSGTPQVFEWENTDGVNWYLDGINFFFWDGSSMDTTDFGAIGGPLANGLLIEFELNSTDYEFNNLQDNMGVLRTFHDHTFTNSPDFDNDENSFLDTARFFSGLARFSPVITLEPGDIVKATVRDNLNGLNDMRISLNKWREI